ncbi:MAG: hypothetical protein Q9P14_05890 [candidate division KSB1 bacterium]|nr:hypothetical protein [candidate division KSB1 bacterium]
MPNTEQEILWEQYLAGGGSEVREQLLLKYLPLVKYVAGKNDGNAAVVGGLR